MKTRFLFILVAAALMFTACNKEEQIIADNTFIYNGVTYHMTDLQLYGGIGGELIGQSTELGPNGSAAVSFCGHHICAEQMNKTFDLTQLYYEGELCNELQMFVCGEVVSFGFRSDKDWYLGSVQETYYEYYDHNLGPTIFKEGTLTLSGDENSKFVYTLKGTLQNDDTVEFRIVLPVGWYNWNPEY